MRSRSSRKAAAASRWPPLRPSIWQTRWLGSIAAMRSTFCNACLASAIGTPTPMAGIMPLTPPISTLMPAPAFAAFFAAGLPSMVTVIDWVKGSPFFRV